MTRIGSLCSGYAGLDEGLRGVIGGEIAWHAENDPDASKVLACRYPGVPNLGDLTAVDWTQVEPVDWLTAGFPCQDLSHAGKRAGIKPGNRSGLWLHIAYVISELRPPDIFIENVRGLLSGKASRDVESGDDGVGDGPADPGRALGVVLGDLASLGYDARWCCVRAADAGAPHGRARIFIVATADTSRRSLSGAAAAGHRLCLATEYGYRLVADTTGDGRDERRTEPAGQLGGSDAAERGATAADSDGPRLEGDWAFAGGAELADVDGDRATPADADRRGFQVRAELDRDSASAAADWSACGGHADRHHGPVAWGLYEPAIRRWERCLGRSAPAPTEPGARGGQRLSPKFVEWMQGLPAGWVTDVPDLSRNAQLKILGNGVVPQQAALALRMLGVSSLAGAA